MTEKKQTEKKVTEQKHQSRRRQSSWQKAAIVLALLLWVAVAWIGSQLVVQLIFNWLSLGNTALNTALLYLAIWVLSSILIIGLPWCVIKMKTTRDELGLRGWPTWTDILLSPIAFVATLILAAVLAWVMQRILPGADWQARQDVGFHNIVFRWEMILAFVSLVVLAPIAEEIVFRGWLYGKLRARMAAPLAIILVSLLFGVLHLNMSVSVTVFVLSVIACLLRELTGTIYGGILLHMIKNGVAFYLLFVVSGGLY